MNLYEFEEAVGSTIVDRGSEYYNAGFVSKLARQGDGRYSALVEGADMYEVAVQLDEEGISFRLIAIVLMIWGRCVNMKWRFIMS